MKPLSEGARVFGAAWLLAAALLSQACGDTAVVEPAAPEPSAQAVATLEAVADAEDILARLQAIPGLTILDEQPSPLPGTRFFRMQFELPANHTRPLGERFQLRVNLLHRSVEAPVVLASSGYGIIDAPVETEPTALLGANQLMLEHRFFGTSRPDSNDWRLLDIRQAASDYHRVIQAFKPLYGARWLTTGGSKGGMAAVYHRYFYPDDVDATVPYVTPNSHGLDDARYAFFLDHVVGTADCRAKLQAFQQDVLQRRDELRPFVEALATTWETGFETIGGADRALEFAAVETSFYFWQYAGELYCSYIPAPGALAEETFFFLDGITGIAFTYGDVELDFYAAYYYQSATELGWTRFPTRHLRGLLRYPGEDEPRAYLSFPVRERFDHGLMLRVEHWVRSRGERMLFVYGENDPWSASAFSVRERNDAFRFYVPGGNHRANIGQLPEPERTFAVERLRAWMGVSSPEAPALAVERAAKAAAPELMWPRFRL
ncbi:hypothetical protein HPC49_39085 [Pyxidicoccus fallax]|uniref:Uncharacterized protein n=1 Tax=Pyxidicoccus fallax TaxID=394095 RepID=A0A848L5S0_9BACT|nr:S28 family serine protease [Pyxidicoccus fallax]NMO13847.1 hypothetical protein [Pyxidicoccus fallax]NPC84205.1 hypothetical protein [Pyxidicoccus fallax]